MRKVFKGYTVVTFEGDTLVKKDHLSVYPSKRVYMYRDPSFEDGDPVNIIVQSAKPKKKGGKKKPADIRTGETIDREHNIDYESDEL